MIVLIEKKGYTVWFLVLNIETILACALIAMLIVVIATSRSRSMIDKQQCQKSGSTTYVVRNRHNHSEKEYLYGHTPYNYNTKLTKYWYNTYSWSDNSSYHIIGKNKKRLRIEHFMLCNFVRDPVDNRLLGYSSQSEYLFELYWLYFTNKQLLYIYKEVSKSIFLSLLLLLFFYFDIATILAGWLVKNGLHLSNITYYTITIIWLFLLVAASVLGQFLLVSAVCFGFINRPSLYDMQQIIGSRWYIFHMLRYNEYIKLVLVSVLLFPLFHKTSAVFCIFTLSALAHAVYFGSYYIQQRNSEFGSLDRFLENVFIKPNDSLRSTYHVIYLVNSYFRYARIGFHLFHEGVKIVIITLLLTMHFITIFCSARTNILICLQFFFFVTIIIMMIIYISVGFVGLPDNAHAIKQYFVRQGLSDQHSLKYFTRLLVCIDATRDGLLAPLIFFHFNILELYLSWCSVLGLNPHLFIYLMLVIPLIWSIRLCHRIICWIRYSEFGARYTPRFLIKAYEYLLHKLKIRICLDGIYSSMQRFRSHCDAILLNVLSAGYMFINPYHLHNTLRAINSDIRNLRQSTLHIQYFLLSSFCGFLMALLLFTLIVLNPGTITLFFGNFFHIGYDSANVTIEMAIRWGWFLFVLAVADHAVFCQCTPLWRLVGLFFLSSYFPTCALAYVLYTTPILTQVGYVTAVTSCKYTVLFLDGIVTFDKVSLFFKLLVLVSTLFVFVFILDWNVDNKIHIMGAYHINNGDIILVTFFLLLGLLGMIGSSDLICSYLFIEITSLSLYILTYMCGKSKITLEIAIKYFINGSLASSLLPLGIFFIYAETGVTKYVLLCHYFDTLTVKNVSMNLILGSVLFLIGSVFKLAAAPFHQWAIDVYDGVTFFLPSIFSMPVKIAFFYVLFKFCCQIFSSISYIYKPLLIVIGCLSLIVGSFGALNHLTVKRFIAYTTMTHTGFIILALANGTSNGFQAGILYFFIYLVLTMLFFLILAHTSYDAIQGNRVEYVLSFEALGHMSPRYALMLSLVLLSFAGVPPLMGSFGKYYVILILFHSELYVPLAVVLLTSLIAAFYYIRIVRVIYIQWSKDKGKGYNRHVGSQNAPVAFTSSSSYSSGQNLFEQYFWNVNIRVILIHWLSFINIAFIIYAPVLLSITSDMLKILYVGF